MEKQSDFNYEGNYGIPLSPEALIGEGNHGKVYRLTEDRVIKICRDSKSCIFEIFILLRTNGSKHFPRIYDFDEHYIIRDYVGGIGLREYIKTNGITRAIILSLIELIEEFQRLGFTKLDVRCRDIMLQTNGSLIVIDPRASFTRNVSYPRHLMKGLKKLGVLDEFIKVLRGERQDLYDSWKDSIQATRKRNKKAKELDAFFENNNERT